MDDSNETEISMKGALYGRRPVLTAGPNGDRHRYHSRDAWAAGEQRAA